MSGKWTIFGAFALLALLTALCLAVVLKVEISPIAEKKKGPVRTREFAEGIRLSQKGLIGIDLVSIGKAHMRKLRKGPISIGALNELVLEDLAVALPEELWAGDAVSSGDAVSHRVNKDESSSSATRRDSASPRAASPRAASPRAASPSERGTAAKRMLAALGINPGHIKMGEKIPRFSALSIKRLRVARIVDGTNAVPWFAAAGGNAGRYGLELYGGWSVEGGVSNTWKEALLVIEPKLELHWR